LQLGHQLDIKIEVSKLDFGMFVTELDRPWTDTDFMYQGFLITTKYQLKKLRKNCSYVIVSVERSSSELFPDVVRTALSAKQQDIQQNKLTTADKLKPGPANRKLDPSSPGFFAGIKQIVKEVVSHRDHVNGLMNSSQHVLNIEMSHDEIIESSIKRKQANEIKELRRGFTKNPATQPQLHTYRDSVATPIEIEIPLAFIAKQDISEVALILAKEMELPITSNQPHKPARTSAEAVKILIEERGKAFHPGLVDQFLQAVGVYPVGTLVKMNTQDIGIVIRQNPMWRLKPVVMLIIGPDGKRLFKPTTVDLLYTTSDSKGVPYKIVNELLPDAYGIDMREYFIHE
jgi:hypothetical protein